MIPARIISAIISWWERRHPPMSKLSAWRKAHEDEQKALQRGCTQDLHRARVTKYHVTHADLAASCGREWGQ